MEIAELLYLGRMFKPLNSPFFNAIKNRYAYLAHDDGWYCRLYLKNYKDLKEIIGNKIVGMASTSKRRKIYPFPQEVLDRLLSFAEKSLVIDFANLRKYEKEIEIPIHLIGKFENMGEMYNGLRRHIGRAPYSAELVHKNKTWSLKYKIIK